VERTRAIGEHLWHGGERVEGLPHLEQAAEQAVRSFAFRDAAELFSRVVEVAREQGDDDLATSAAMGQAAALDAAGATTRALGLYRDLLERPERLRRAEDRRRRGEICLGACRLHGKLSEYDDELRVADEGLALGLESTAVEIEVGLLEAKSDALLGLGNLEGAFAAARRGLKISTHRSLVRARGALLDTLGTIERRRGAWRKARFLFRRGLEAALLAGDEHLVAEVRHHLSELERSGGEWRQAREGYEANLDTARRLHDPWIELDSLHALAALECRRGEWKSAREPLQRSLELRRRLGTRDGQTESWVLMGEIAEMLGDWSLAEQNLRRVLKVLPRDEGHRDRMIAETHLASLARKRGNWTEAEDLARSALAGAESTGDRRLLALCHHQLGLVEKDRSHFAPASAHLQRALEVAEDPVLIDLRPRLWYSMGDLAIRRGELDDARDHFTATATTAKELGLRFELAKSKMGLGRLAVAERRKGGGDAEFSEAVQSFGELEVPFEYARALYEWGVRTRDTDLAVDRLDRALVAFERLGAATDFERSRGVIDGIRERNFLENAPGHMAPGIWEVARLINSTLDLQEVLDTTMDLVLERLQAERGMVVLVGRISQELEVAVSRNLDSSIDESTHLSETVVRRVIEDRQPILSVDAMADTRFAESESIVAAHIVSILCVPLIIRDRLAGAIYIDHRSSQHLFEPRDLEFLLAFSDQAAIAIENARLYGEVEERRQKLKAENESLRKEIGAGRSLDSLIGRSRAVEQLKETLERVAVSQTTILIRGESGTGKGLVARILHAVSTRREGPFIHFNCAALPETLVESELFGHEKGSFTGATGQKPGRFELAKGGTIFLDEIGKVSRSVQAKLLRVVEDRRFERVGGTKTLEADVRIVAATNLNLEEAITSGEFREDLYYRLNIIPIILPPLRERKEDIPHLVEHFFNKIRRD
ncbi:MAG: sigma 54-interacting transcriptional regulator, partial [Thermoanaerobaculia bacterium]|nr:sigma 54-interacting transcriptional regulator [Thermoanaerobaculia bacterium]